MSPKELAKSAVRPVGRLVFRKLFRVWERLGFHITPCHFYQPIPDTRTLKDDLWQTESALIGIDMNESQQLRLLEVFVERFKPEYEALPRDRAERPYGYYINNGAFEAVDGEVLYCMVRYFKPKTIIEIGAGYSTYLSAQAVQRNRIDDPGYRCDLIAIDPYPNEVIKRGFPGLTRLIARRVQDVDLREFARLGENDILFIDSSHVLTIGSDVRYEYLEILPRLAKGVLVHAHDIFLPAEYPRKWVLEEYRFWNEQYLLQAFLAFNASFEVLWASSYMHLRHADRLEKAFSSYTRTTRWPGSFWIRRVR